MNAVLLRIFSAALLNQLTQSTGMAQCPAGALPLTSVRDLWRSEGLARWAWCLLLLLSAWKMEYQIQGFSCLVLISSKFCASSWLCMLRIYRVGHRGIILEELESKPNRSTILQYSHSLAQITSCSDHLPSSKHLLRQESEDMSFAMAT